MKMPQPSGFIRMPKDKSYPGSFIIRNRGHYMDSPQAAMRIKDGDYIMVHPIFVEETIGKAVVLNTPDTLNTVQVVYVTSSYLVVCFFAPYRMEVKIPLSQICEIYSVDAVIGNLERQEIHRCLNKYIEQAI